MLFTQIGIAENTLRELDCVLENGQYRFILQSTSDVVQCDLELKFCLTPEPPVKRATGTIVVLNPENDDVSTNAEEGSLQVPEMRTYVHNKTLLYGYFGSIIYNHYCSYRFRW